MFHVIYSQLDGFRLYDYLDPYLCHMDYQH